MSSKAYELTHPVSNGKDPGSGQTDETWDGNSDDTEVVVEKMELRRELGLPGGISMIVGCIIGSGIFVSPKGVLDATGSVGTTLCVWAGSGLIALMGGLCYGELGTLIPKSGGEYSYIRQAFGNLLAFLYTWVAVVLIRPSSLAIMSLTFGTYFNAVFELCGGGPDLPPKIAAIVCLLSILILNCYSTRLAARLQIITTVAKTAALCVVIVGGIYKMASDYDNTARIRSGFDGSVTDPSTIALAFYDALWAYDGWNNLNYVTEEMKQPGRDLPRANIISVVTVIIVYLLTNIGYLSVMTKQELLDADAVAVLWGDRVLKGASIIMPISVMISTFGSCNATAFAGGRSVFAAARDGNFPELFSFINVKQLTPIPSMVFTIAVAVIFILLGDISSLIDFFSFTAWLFYGITFSALLYFRVKKPDAERPYKVPLPIPIIMVVISIYLVIAPIVQDPAIEFLYAAIFVVGGSVLYFPFVYFNLKVPFIDEFTMWVQLLFEVVPTSKFED